MNVLGLAASICNTVSILLGDQFVIVNNNSHEMNACRLLLLLLPLLFPDYYHYRHHHHHHPYRPVILLCDSFAPAAVRI